MCNIELFGGSILSVPDECYTVVCKYIKRINEVEYIRESYAIVLPEEIDSEYKVSIECVVEDCSDKWIERIYDLIDISIEGSDVLARPVMRSEFVRGFNITRGLEHLRIKVQDSSWYGFAGDIPRCDMVDIGGSVVAAVCKADKLKWYRQEVFPYYSKVNRVYVVGSAIRNWCTPESDIDLLVVCDNDTDCDEMLVDIDTRFESSVYDDILVCTSSDFVSSNRGFIKSVKEDGALLYVS